jgi:hypothetical protein
VFSFSEIGKKLYLLKNQKININTGCPRTGTPEKKGSLRADILTCILKKKVLSQMITEKRHSEVDQSELSTIKVE